MRQPLTLVIDQGTHATRALALDEDARVVASAFCEIELRRLSPDHVEQDAEEIVASMHRVVEEVLNDATVRRLGVACAGLATQRSSVVAWDKRTGRALAPLISWQDRRAAAWLSQFDPRRVEIKERTGLRLSPHYGASKLHWYLEHLPAVKQAHREGCLAFGPLASYLIYHLLAGRPLLVDHANAARTQLWNIETREWDPWLLELFDIPSEPLPACRPICHEYGRLQVADIPLTAVNGDQNAAIYSLGQPRRDHAIVNLGTGAFILSPTGNEVVRHPALLSGLASSQGEQGEYVVEGTVNGAGAALDWAAAQWGIEEIPTHLSDWLVREQAPPLFLNTIGGLGSPWWKAGPPPVVVGEGAPWQRIVAVAESILFLLQANLDAMLEQGLPIERLRISGGLARADALCQRLADLSGRPLYRPAETEATARGIAWLAAGAPDHWPEPGEGVEFIPAANEPLQRRYHTFCDLLEQAGPA